MDTQVSVKPRGNPAWHKGMKQVVPNPGGRPKALVNVRELARTYTEDAIERMARVMKNDLHPQQLAACMALLDRAWGKPEQHITTDASTWDAMGFGERAMLARALEIIAAAGLDINDAPAIDVTPTSAVSDAPHTDDSVSDANHPNTDDKTTP